MLGRKRKLRSCVEVPKSTPYTVPDADSRSAYLRNQGYSSVDESRLHRQIRVSVPFCLSSRLELEDHRFRSVLHVSVGSRTKTSQAANNFGCGVHLNTSDYSGEPVCSGICTNNPPQGKRKQAERPISVAGIDRSKALVLTSPASVRYVWTATAFPQGQPSL